MATIFDIPSFSPARGEGEEEFSRKWVTIGRFRLRSRLKFNFHAVWIGEP